jgi:hypothetical protein
MSIEKSMKDVIADALKDGYLNNGNHAQIGDHVRVVRCDACDIAKTEFIGKEAVIDTTYLSKFGCGSPHSLGLKFRDNHVSWFNANQLEFIKADQLHLVDEWKIAEIRKKKRMKSFDFLVKWAKKYPENSPPKECISFIWEQINPGKSIWGSHGEGMRALMNSLTVIRVWITVVRSFNKPVTDQNKAQFRKHLVSVVNTFRKANKASSNV